MLWEESPSAQRFVVPDTVVDLVFSIHCRSLPLDHAYALSQAITAELPWLSETATAGIHTIHGAASGNGWYRPEDDSGDALLYLSRRAKLELRLPRERVEDARKLVERSLDVAGHSLRIGACSVRLLSPLNPLFARYIIADPAQDEAAFLAEMADGLRRLGLNFRRMLCGRSHHLTTADTRHFTRSLLVADLSPTDAVRLQEHGLGPGRLIGCGLFIPHKGIDPVSQSNGD